MDRSEMVLWVLKVNPLATPSHAEARMWVNSKPTDNVFKARDLDSIRQLLPGGLSRITCSAKDDPFVVETWMKK